MSSSRAADLLRFWVGLYTRGLPAEVRQGRRQEIEADLWDQLAEANLTGRPERSVGGEILTRLVLGAPADLTWRFGERPHGDVEVTREGLATPSALIGGVLAIVGGAAVAIGAAVFARTALEDSTLRPWERSVDALTLSAMAVAGTVGLLAIAAAVVGLAFAFRRRSSGAAVVAASIGAASAVAGVLDVWPAIYLVPAGLAYFIWDLGRIGVLPRWISAANVTSALVLLIPMAAVASDSPAGVAIVLVVPYWITWLAIGRSLIRGTPLVLRV